MIGTDRTRWLARVALAAGLIAVPKCALCVAAYVAALCGLGVELCDARPSATTTVAPTLIGLALLVLAGVVVLSRRHLRVIRR